MRTKLSTATSPETGNGVTTTMRYIGNVYRCRPAKIYKSHNSAQIRLSGIPRQPIVGCRVGVFSAPETVSRDITPAWLRAGMLTVEG